VEWLKHLELDDYVDRFKENHIDGNNLFEITEADLKDDFKMTSFGHRKNFLKAVENLKKIYCGHAGKNSDYIRKKIQRFYEKNKHKFKGGIFNSLSSMEGRFYSHRKFYSRDIFTSKHEIIEEDDEHSMKPEESPKINGMKGIHHSARSSTKDAKSIDEDNDNEEKKDSNSHHSPLHSGHNHLELKKDKSGSSRGTPSRSGPKDALNARRRSSLLEDFRLDGSPAQKPVEKEQKDKEKHSGDGITSSSSSESSESSGGEEEKSKKTNENHNANKPIWEALGKENRDTKVEKKKTKTTSSNSSQIFRSTEMPTVSRQVSKKVDNGTRKKNNRKKKKNDIDYVNEKISNKTKESLLISLEDEILRKFKESGLNENFIIDYNELTIEKKIGEGGRALRHKSNK